MTDGVEETAANLGGPTRVDGLRLFAAAVGARLLRVTVWQWAMAAVVLLYAWYFTSLSLEMHRGLGTSTFDYGLYDQGVWLISRFKAPFVTLMGRNLFGDHTSFILILLAPIYWVAPGAGTLLGTQSLAAALGAVPVFLYARLRLGSEALALLLGSLFLLHPALQWTNLEDFHPDMYLVPLVTFGLYAALTSKWRMYAVCVAFALLVKEDVALVTIPLGIWVAWRRDLVIGLATIGASVAYAFFAMLVVIGGLSGAIVPNAWRIPFGGVGGFLGEIATRPGNVFDYLRADDRPWYLWQMASPFAWVMVRAPEIALISGLVLATNVISNFGYQHRIDFHYSAVALPALAMGTVYALGRFEGRRRVMVAGVVAVSSLWAAYLWGPLPLARQQVAYWPADHPVAESARYVTEVVPDDAVVSAHFALTPHLARREHIFSSLERSRMPVADEVDFVVLRVPLSEEDAVLWESVSSDFAPVRANGDWALYTRADRSGE
jgi:uncharacterized membrane protein